MQSVCYNGQMFSPSKIVCVGRNYAAHIDELGNVVAEQMVIFTKPATAITQRLFARHQEPLSYETELAFLFRQGRFCAVAVGLDLTKRGLQSSLKSQGLPWERAKGFDGSALFSEFVTIDEVTEQLTIELDIDGQLQQRGQVGMMLYKPDNILEEIQQFMTLQDNDVVMTGTPAGVGELQAGTELQGRVMLDGRCLVSHSWQVE